MRRVLRRLRHVADHGYSQKNESFKIFELFFPLSAILSVTFPHSNNIFGASTTIRLSLQAAHSIIPGI